MAANAAALAAPSNSNLKIKSERATRKILKDAKSKELSSPQIANRILREIGHLTGVADPYREFKTREMAQNVATEAEESSANAQSLSSATEEMVASVQEISKQVQQSSEVAKKAVQSAEASKNRRGGR